jgi:hypothetical protein
MDQSRDDKSIVTRFVEAAGLKERNMTHGRILPIAYFLTSKYLTTTPVESSEMQEAYNLCYIMHWLIGLYVLQEMKHQLFSQQAGKILKATWR